MCSTHAKPTSRTELEAVSRESSTMTDRNTERLHQAQEFLDKIGVGALSERMGMKIVEFDYDHAVATMPVAGNTQPLGLMHGGAYAVLGESLGSIHSNLLAPEGHVAVGVDINATHTGSAVSGLVTAVCTPISVGRTLAVHEIVITDESGKRCSTVRITNFFKKQR